METITLVNWKTKSPIFTYKAEDNTIAKTLLKAVRKKINLQWVDLSEADLYGIDLRKLNLSYAKLTYAKMRKADLAYSKLVNTDLSYADLSEANLNFTYLREADLSNAFLQYASMNYVYLRGANLSNADLKFAVICSACFTNNEVKGANFSHTCLENSYISNTNFNDADILPDYPINIPEGECIVWKKIDNKVIVKMKLLSDSKRSRSVDYQCRCDKAFVLEFQDLDGTCSDEYFIVEGYLKNMNK